MKKQAVPQIGTACFAGVSYASYRKRIMGFSGFRELRARRRAKFALSSHIQNFMTLGGLVKEYTVAVALRRYHTSLLPSSGEYMLLSSG